MQTSYKKFIFFKIPIKDIFRFLAIFCCASLIAPMARACDPLGCLLGGHKQDVLILGEAVNAQTDSLQIKIDFVFPQNQIRSIKAGDQITVTNLAETIISSDSQIKTLTVGKKYLMSLNKDKKNYIPAWGIYEVYGNTYLDVQLVKNQTADDAAVQIFINSGGTKKDFYFANGKAFLVEKNGQMDTQIYPRERNIFWRNVHFRALTMIMSLVFIKLSL